MSGFAAILAIVGLSACGTSKATSDAGTAGSTEDGGGGSTGAAGRGAGGGEAGRGAGGSGGGAAGGRGGASGCVRSDGTTSCTGTQVCVVPECMRASAVCQPITCTPNTNCCQAAVSCIVDGGTGCMSPVRPCIDSPVSFCADVPAGCAGTPTCGCLPGNVCTGGQSCVSVNDRRVVGCSLP